MLYKTYSKKFLKLHIEYVSRNLNKYNIYENICNLKIIMFFSFIKSTSRLCSTMNSKTIFKSERLIYSNEIQLFRS